MSNCQSSFHRRSLLFLGSLLLLAIALTAVPVKASPVASNGISFEKRGTCNSPPVRKEWRTLTDAEKSSYLKAVQCLADSKTAKSISGISGARNRFDDHQGVHSSQTPSIHWVGHFALWHRYFVATYEKSLRDVCGYKGGQPYWNWSLDVAKGKDFVKSPIFCNDTGFGGNGPYKDGPNPFAIPGRSGGGCVPKGPFTYPKFSVNMGPGNSTAYNPHCLTRDFSRPIMESFAQQSLVDWVKAAPDYGWFAKRLENVPDFTVPNIHGSGHFGVGGALGTLGDAYNSPGDPLFYLHHGNLDRILWEWQQKDLKKRLSDVSGPIVPFDYTNQVAGNVTLDFSVNMGKLAPATTLRHLLNIKGDVLCYDYA